MTDINSRIRWQPGMVLTADTFGNLDDNIELRQRIAVRTANGLRYGLLPDAVFSAKGFFADGCYEIECLQCTALLPTGDMISPNESVRVPFERKDAEYCYLCVGLGIGFVEYEHNNVPYLRPQYAYSIETLSEIERDGDVLPIVRFHIKDGKVSIDNDYIIPSLVCGGDPHIMEEVSHLADAVARLAEHENMAEGDAHQTLLRYLFRLRGFSARNTMESLVELTEEIMQAVHYCVVIPAQRNTMGAHPTETQKLEQRLGKSKITETDRLVHPEISYIDIQLWLNWCKSYLAHAEQVLDGTTRTDDTIDLQALKQEIREELFQQLYQRLHPELTTSICNALHDQLLAEVDAHIDEVVHDYADGTVRQQLHDTLHEALRPDLYDTLYRALYEALYEALQVPETVEEHFYTPII